MFFVRNWAHKIHIASAFSWFSHFLDYLKLARLRNNHLQQTPSINSKCVGEKNIYAFTSIERLKFSHSHLQTSLSFDAWMQRSISGMKVFLSFVIYSYCSPELLAASSRLKSFVNNLWHLIRISAPAIYFSYAVGYRREKQQLN